MKKSILIPLILVIIVAFAAIIMFFKPDNTGKKPSDSMKQVSTDIAKKNTTAIDANPVNTDNIRNDAANSQEQSNTNDIQTIITDDSATGVPSDLPLKEDGSVDFNAAVYGNQIQQFTDSEGKSTLSNTESNYTIKVIDPETDPANELANSNTVKPLKPQSEESKANLLKNTVNDNNGSVETVE